MTLLDAVKIPDSLKNASGSGFFDNFKIFASDPNSKSSVDFYQAWIDVLHPQMAGAQKLGGMILGAIANGLYTIADACLRMWKAVFDFFPSLYKIDGFTDAQSTITKVAIAVVSVTFLWFGATIMFKGLSRFKKTATFMTKFVVFIVMLPTVIGWGLKFMGYAGDAFSVDGKATNIAVQPFQDNVVDKLKLAKDDFNTDPTDIGGDTGFSKYNSITTTNLKYIDFSEIIAKDNIKAVDDGQAKPFQYAYVSGTGDDSASINELSLPSKQFSITKMGNSVYSRYYVRWLSLYATLIVTAGLLLMMTLRAVTGIFNYLFYAIMSPILVAWHFGSTKILKEAISNMVGPIVGIWGEVVGVQLFITMIGALNGIVSQISVLDGHGITSIFFKIIVMVGSFFAIFKGLDQLEAKTGYNTGSSDQLSQMVGAGMIGGMAAGGAINGGKSVGSAISGLGDRVRHPFGGGNKGGDGPTPNNPGNGSKNSSDAIKNGPGQEGPATNKKDGSDTTPNGNKTNDDGSQKTGPDGQKDGNGSGTGDPNELKNNPSDVGQSGTEGNGSEDKDPNVHGGEDNGTSGVGSGIDDPGNGVGNEDDNFAGVNGNGDDITGDAGDDVSDPEVSDNFGDPGTADLDDSPSFGGVNDSSDQSEPDSATASSGDQSRPFSKKDVGSSLQEMSKSLNEVKQNSAKQNETQRKSSDRQRKMMVNQQRRQRLMNAASSGKRQTRTPDQIEDD